MITGVVLARNEEANIVECLQSFRPHVGELILIDMESSDRTVELASPFVDKNLSHPTIPNFDSARNIAIPEARYDWLWFLDADERVPVETGQLVNDIVKNRGHEFVALTIPFKTHFCGKWIQHCGWWPGYTMPRVLKRGHFRFAERLHGGVEFDGPSMQSPADPNLAIEHFSYLSIEHYVEKFNRYTSVEAIQLADAGVELSWETAIRAMVRDLWLYYEKNQGHLDGRHGWILSWLAGQYRWFSHTKMLDRLRAQGTGEDDADVPPNLDAVIQLMETELHRIRAAQPEL
ncbi:MAG: glycosyltransferase family 2 protein, partial [Planctomycetes bacterium]|nr:glycosyltransferase family 2 protein [Planctomycetota bacterium]